MCYFYSIETVLSRHSDSRLYRHLRYLEKIGDGQE